MPKFVKLSLMTHNAHQGAAEYSDLADIMYRQEVSSESRDDLRRALPDFYHYFHGELCTSIRKDKFIPIKKRTRKIVDGEAKLGPNRYQLRWDVALREDPSTRFRLVNTHLTNGVQKGKWPLKWRRDAHRRGRRMFAQAGRFVARKKTNRQIGLGGGDFNWKFKWNIVKNWKAFHHQAGNVNDYDRLLYVPHPRLTPVRAWEGKRFGSDHKAIFAIVKVELRNGKPSKKWRLPRRRKNKVEAPALDDGDENVDQLVGEELEDDLDLDLDSFDEIDSDLEVED